MIVQKVLITADHTEQLEPLDIFSTPVVTGEDIVYIRANTVSKKPWKKKNGVVVDVWTVQAKDEVKGVPITIPAGILFFTNEFFDA